MKYKIFIIGKILLSAIGVMTLFAAIIGLGNYLQSINYKYIGNFFMMLFPVSVYGYVGYLNKKINKLSLADYGFTAHRLIQNLGLGFIVSTVIMGAVLLASGPILGSTVEFMPLKENFLSPLISLAAMAIIVGVWEEFYFRGFVFNTLVNAKFGFHISALVSSLLFSILHWTSFDMDETSWLWYIGIVLIGYILVVIYTLSKSIWSVVAFHFLWNFYATLLDSEENEIGLSSIKNYAGGSKSIDNLTVIILATALALLLLFSHRKIKQLYPAKNMFTFPGK